MARKGSGKRNVRVTRETASGRNKQFLNKGTGTKMTRLQFVKAIKAGKYPKYHVGKINGVLTPVSNPNYTTADNLG